MLCRRFGVGLDGLITKVSSLYVHLRDSTKLESLPSLAVIYVAIAT